METDLSGVEHIGARLLKARLEEHLTQELLAELSGTNQSLIQKIENGFSLRPRPLMELAEALNVNPAWLQFGEPYAQKKKRPGGNSPEELEADPEAKLADWLTLAERVIRRSKKAHLAETARLLALTLAKYQHQYGELPLEHIEKLSQTKNINDDNEQLVKTGTETLIRTLRFVTMEGDNK